MEDRYIMNMIIKTEFWKMKRYHIMLIGAIGMFCSPLLQLFSQLVAAPEAKHPDFGFAALVEMTLWGDAQIFMPVMFTLIGGYLMNREYTDDTLKNILTVPLSFRRLLAGKLAAVGILAVILGVYSIFAALFVSIFAGLSDINILTFLRGILQAAGLSVGIYIAVLPLLAVCGRKPGMFMGGSVAAFLAGYCCLFFKQGILRSIYPFSAALTMIRFDMSSYTGTTEKGSILLGLASLGCMLGAAMAIVWFSGKPGEVGRRRKKEAGRKETRRREGRKRR
ncbi:MAG: ABC transporter permease [Clostridium sp.]|nr:ABC transporter permease [Clostridium sp.]